MSRRRVRTVLLAAALGIGPIAAGDPEEAYRANNIGVALLEQFEFAQAAAAFQRALRIDPRLPPARHNLSIARLHILALDDAERDVRAAIDLLPGDPRPHYVLGLVLKAKSRVPDALAAFERVRQMDPHDVGTNVNIGQLLFAQGRYAQAIAAFEAASSAEPSNSTAAYSLALALTRAGRADEGGRMMARFQALRESGSSIELGNRYLEQGRYAEAMVTTGSEPWLADPTTPDVAFVSMPAAFARSGTAAGGGLTLVDVDGDGDLDLVEVTPSRERLWRNDGGRFADVTARAGFRSGRPQPDTSAGAVAGDYDNDGRPDLFVLRRGGSALYRNEGGGRFRDVASAAGVSAAHGPAAALFDADHDGDLDLFAAALASAHAKEGDTARALLRNNGNGTFTEIAASAGLVRSRRAAVAVVPTDYDNHRDADLLLVAPDGPPELFANQRDGTFRDVARGVGLPDRGRFTTIAAGDTNKDGYGDFYFGSPDGAGVFAVSDGHGRFTGAPAPAAISGTTAAQFLDYDNDGLLDLLVFCGDGPRLLRNAGGRWIDVSARAFRATAGIFRPAFARGVVSGDLDGDGDTDLIVQSERGELGLWRNEGGSRNRSLAVRLAARVSNRTAAGTKIEMLAGSLRQKLETVAATPAPRPADLVFGLGRRATADVVRILWPAGIVQSELRLDAAARLLNVTELDRKPSSCPYLFAWNGQRFAFATDFLGGGEFGYWLAPGVRNTPDPGERVRLRADQLVPRDGRYEIRVTNELEETLYLDRLRLDVVAHPRDVDVYPDVGIRGGPRSGRDLYVVRDARPPRAVVDEHGHDVLSRIRDLDRRSVDDFAVLPLRGYAVPHALTLDIGPTAPHGAVLLLTGWTDYAFSSDNVAAHQAGLTLAPPSLQVKTSADEWRTVADDIGIPAGRPQTVVVDLARAGAGGHRELRIVTSMRVYWDQIRVATVAGAAERSVTPLNPLAAELRWRGYSADAAPDGRAPLVFDYERVSRHSPWKVMAGRYTRTGDVKDLLSATDDLFVVARTGDEIAVAFAAARVPPLPEGWTRTFLLHADGFSKEMDLNSASPDTVGPLPSRARVEWPAAALQHRDNTRLVRAPIPRIETVLLDR